MIIKIPDNVAPEDSWFFGLTQIAYIVALSVHIALGIFFLILDIHEMALFNFLLSVPIFSAALVLNRLAFHNVAFSLAVFELYFHQVTAVYILGWDSGFQYYLIFLAALPLFNARWSGWPRLVFILFICVSYLILYTFFKVPDTVRLAPFYAYPLYVSNAITTLILLVVIINYFVQSAVQSEAELKVANQKSEEMANLLKKMFGRYLSTEVMTSLMEDPAALELGGEKRPVTIMMTDLRGFSALCERLEPEEVMEMLNIYFDVMIPIIDRYQGTVNEIIGDALLVIFGAPQKMSDRCEKAAACALEMQNAMAEVNRLNRSKGLPELGMGIGLNDTEAIVGNIGSDKRSKYAVVGSGVNITSRIESYSIGGQILVSESVVLEAGGILRIESQRDVLPKGRETPLRIYSIDGIAGDYGLVLEQMEPDPTPLVRRIPVTYTLVAGKNIDKSTFDASIISLSSKSAELISTTSIGHLANIKMNLVGVDEKLSAKDFYGKAVGSVKKLPDGYLIRFTAVPPEIDAYFQAHIQHAMTGSND